MAYRVAKLFLAAILLVALWGLNTLREPAGTPWVQRIGATPGPVKILRFYASTGAVTLGEKAMLCYGVVNAKAVRISPLISAVSPSTRRCLVVVPDHTTHYTLLAEGFDGQVATRSVTVPVQVLPQPPQLTQYAEAAVRAVF